MTSRGSCASVADEAPRGMRGSARASRGDVTQRSRGQPRRYATTALPASRRATRPRRSRDAASSAVSCAAPRSSSWSPRSRSSAASAGAAAASCCSGSGWSACAPTANCSSSAATPTVGQYDDVACGESASAGSPVVRSSSEAGISTRASGHSACTLPKPRRCPERPTRRKASSAASCSIFSRASSRDWPFSGAMVTPSTRRGMLLRSMTLVSSSRWRLTSDCSVR
mmetsp:Transcript_231/g.781  ORF Transcript_231/g.781 Transcript_231/m.781 type:complete len:226 (+) Transcript_231:649-1326(+)